MNDTNPNSPLTILHTEASLGWGGQEIRVLTEAAGMARRGHRVLLAAPAEARIFAEAARHQVEAVALPIGRKRLAGMTALVDLYAREAFAIVNTHSSTDTWLAALANLRAAKPPVLVRTRHISAPIPANFASRWLYRHATQAIVTTGAALREQVIREMGVRPERIVSVPTGIDLSRYQPVTDRAAVRQQLGLPATAAIVGIVATLRSWKGHRYLIDAMTGLPAAHLVIVGDGPQREALMAQVAQHELHARVHLVGNQADVVPWLQSLDVFCLPSYANEGVPQALMQAMACGLPVVSTPVGAISEIVADGVTGRLVAPEDAGALTAALRSLLADPELAARLACAARESAVARFGLERMLDAMTAVFRQALATPNVAA
jgi:glycosyltransferase involved in cell wall biosynthesis